MFLINTTFQVDNNVTEMFADFVRDEMIPVATREFGMTSPVFTRIRPHEGADDDGKSTGFALQLRAVSQDIFQRYSDECLPAFLSALYERWGMSVMYFTSVLDIIHG